LLEQLRDQRVLVEERPLPPPTTGFLPQRNNILRTELEEAIRFLPSKERVVFLLMDVEGYPASRVAELLELSNAEVLRTALTARMRIRAELANANDNREAA
jgi:DNA-directed RNA polymerase specialized sigma24 family protein